MSVKALSIRTRGGSVGLRTKFNLVMVSAFLIGLAIATFLAREITIEEPVSDPAH